MGAGKVLVQTHLEEEFLGRAKNFSINLYLNVKEKIKLKFTKDVKVCV